MYPLDDARLAALAALGCALATIACDGPPAPLAGLTPRAYSYVDHGGERLGHSRELLVDEDLLFVADANGLPVLRWEPDRLALLHGIDPDARVHCSSLALHRASRTLLCTAADFGPSALVDVRDPAVPVWRPWPLEGLTLPIPSVPDVAIGGDTAWLAANDRGLLRSSITPSGEPGLPEATGVGASVVQVEVAGDRVVLLDRAEGLVVLDAGTLARLGSAPLAGPPLDLAVDGDRVVVSLGSEGAEVLALGDDGRPTSLFAVQPRCVATASDLSGDQLAVACLSGVTLYDLGAPEPRVVGFLPSRYGMLDVAFTDYGLVVADWYRVDVLAPDLAGRVIVPDVPRGMRLAPGESATIPIRNPGDEPLEVGWQLSAEGDSATHAGETVIGPAGEAVIELASELLEAADSAGNRAEVVFFPRGLAPDADSPRTRLWHRGPTTDPAEGRVGIGDPFPLLRRTVDSPAPETLPPQGAGALIMFLTVDCYLQWPQLEDMAWAQDRATGRPAPVVFFLTTMDEDPFDPSHFMRNFDADRLLTVEWADYHHSVPGNEAEPNPVATFERSFMMRLPGADFPHDYVLDASGTVTATSRLYRGRWPLGE